MRFKTFPHIPKSLPAIGWGAGFGGHRARHVLYGRDYEECALLALRNSLSLVDTAEAYGAGKCEEALGRVIEESGQEVFLITKAAPENLHPDNLLKAAHASLSRLGIKSIDCYMIHWPNPTIPLEATLSAMDVLLEQGLIRSIGICNCSTPYLEKALSILGPGKIVAVQAEMNLTDRWAADELLPICEEHGLLFIAHSPLGHGRLAQSNAVLGELAHSLGLTPAGLALAWLAAHHDVIPIPHSLNPEHLAENARAGEVQLTDDILRTLDSMRILPCLLDPSVIYVPNSLGAWSIKSEEEARNNTENLSPSPLCLAEAFASGQPFRPVKVTAGANYEPGKLYTLQEGALRYWSHRLAFGSSTPVPALVLA